MQHLLAQVGGTKAFDCRCSLLQDLALTVDLELPHRLVQIMVHLWPRFALRILNQWDHDRDIARRQRDTLPQDVLEVVGVVNLRKRNEIDQRFSIYVEVAQRHIAEVFIWRVANMIAAGDDVLAAQ